MCCDTSFLTTFFASLSIYFPFRSVSLGQQLVEEILDAQRAGCPPEYFNIPIPKGNRLFDPDSHGGRELPFLRTRYDMRTGNSPNAPREQVGGAEGCCGGYFTK